MINSFHASALQSTAANTTHVAGYRSVYHVEPSVERTIGLAVMFHVPPEQRYELALYMIQAVYIFFVVCNITVVCLIFVRAFIGWLDENAPAAHLFPTLHLTPLPSLVIHDSSSMSSTLPQHHSILQSNTPVLALASTVAASMKRLVQTVVGFSDVLAHSPDNQRQDTTDLLHVFALDGGTDGIILTK